MDWDTEAAQSGGTSPEPRPDQPKKKPSRLRKALLAVGGLTFVLGVALLGFGAYSYLSDDGDGRADPPAVIDLGVDDDLLDLHAGTPHPGPATPTPVPAPPLGESAYQIVIEKIGVDAPVQTFGLDTSAAPEIPIGDDAADIVAWYDFSARPGTGSNAVFAGHVTWFGPAVFYNLTSLGQGDVIKLRGQDGTELTYAVSSVFSVAADDPEAVQVMWASETDIMTIITCDGTFTDTDDPVTGGEYNNRLVIRADLQSVAPAAVQADAPASGG